MPDMLDIDKAVKDAGSEAGEELQAVEAMANRLLTRLGGAKITITVEIPPQETK